MSAKRTGVSVRLSPAMLTSFFLTLLRYVEARLPLERALLIMQDGPERALRRLAETCVLRMRQGGLLTEGVGTLWYGKQAQVALALLRAGEALDRLQPSLEAVVAHLSRVQKVQQRTKQALRYPLLLLGVFVLCTAAVFYTLVPVLAQAQQASGSGAEAGSLWRTVCFIQAWGVSVLVSVLGVLGLLVVACRTTRGRWALHRMVLALPFVGPMVLQERLSHFFYVLSLGMEQAMAVPAALSLARETLFYQPLLSVAQRAAEDTKGGKNVAQALGPMPGVTPDVLHLLRVAEETGQAAQLCKHVSALYQDRLSLRQEKVQTYVGPLVLALMGLAFLWLAQSIVGPLYDEALWVGA